MTCAVAMQKDYCCSLYSERPTSWKSNTAKIVLAQLVACGFMSILSRLVGLFVSCWALFSTSLRKKWTKNETKNILLKSPLPQSNSVHRNAPLEYSPMLLMRFRETMVIWCCWHQNVILGMQKFQHFAALSMFSILNLTRIFHHLCFIFV